MKFIIVREYVVEDENLHCREDAFAELRECETDRYYVTQEYVKKVED